MTRSRRRWLVVAAPAWAAGTALVLFACVGEPDRAPPLSAPPPAASSTLVPPPGAGGDGGGDLPDVNIPEVVEPIAVDTQATTTCVVMSDGRVYCWGANDRLQAGDPAATTVIRRPFLVEGIDDAVQVSTGFSHACARTRSGGVRCWGTNDSRQLGRDTEDVGAASAAPVSVAGLPAGDPVVDVSAGIEFTCALTRGGKVYCWGSKDFGNIYAPDASSSAVPPTLLVIPGEAQQPLFESLGSQGHHSCAVDRLGESYCWGDNFASQLGHAGTDGVPAKGVFSAPRAAVVGSSTHTCLVESVNGPRCFGSNLAGQLGDVDVVGPGTAVPQRIPGMDQAAGAVTVAAGSQHTCAIYADGGVVKCVGTNSDGQLGDPALDAGVHLAPVPVPGVSDVVALAAGDHHNCALRRVNGRTSVICWGGNAFGQLGVSSDAGSLPPKVVDGLE